MVWESTSARSAFTICRDTDSGVDSLWHWVMVFTTRSTRGRGGASDRVEPFAVVGVPGGEVYAVGVTVSSKNE